MLMMMDCTGSMQSWINEAGKKLVSIINEVQSKASLKNKIKVGYVGYRDFGDRGQDKGHMDIHPYSEDISTVSAKILSSKAFGGNDTCEDVHTALEEGLLLKNEAKTQLIYLCLDAPCHGKWYSSCMDDHEDKYGQGSLEDLMRRYSQQPGKNVYFTVIQINKKNTEQMCNMMRASFGDNFSVIDINSTDDFKNFVMDTMTKSLEDSRLRIEEEH